ncbi:hypothetical protein B0H11DRAFT_1036826 [Mycena galericulata]|nr:hypothetical protein B0H11DRAFT_1036826 [Mycena galericulata]
MDRPGPRRGSEPPASKRKRYKRRTGARASNLPFKFSPIRNLIYWTFQLYSAVLAGLFPHLAKFTPQQNAALLDIILSPNWTREGPKTPLWMNNDTFRLVDGSPLLFEHGEPNADLVVQLVGRCMGWAPRSYSEPQTLFEYVALPIQRYWPAIAGTRILDTALLMYCMALGRPVPFDKVFQ